MTITSVAAIGAMVKARFDAAGLQRITISPEYDTIDELVKVIAQIATTFKTKRYDVNVVSYPSSSAKMRRAASQTIMPLISAVPSNQLSETPGSPYPLSPNDNKTLHA